MNSIKADYEKKWRKNALNYKRVGWVGLPIRYEYGNCTEAGMYGPVLNRLLACSKVRWIECAIIC